MWECKWPVCRVLMAWIEGVAAHWLSLTTSSPRGVGTRSRVSRVTGRGGGIPPGTSHGPQGSFRQLKPRGSPVSLQMASTSVCPSYKPFCYFLHSHNYDGRTRLEKMQRKVDEVSERLQPVVWQTYTPRCGESGREHASKGGGSASRPPRLGGFVTTSVVHTVPAQCGKLQRC